jgi:hypothetical protein
VGLVVVTATEHWSARPDGPERRRDKMLLVVTSSPKSRIDYSCEFFYGLRLRVQVPIADLESGFSVRFVNPRNSNAALDSGLSVPRARQLRSARTTRKQLLCHTLVCLCLTKTLISARVG